MKINSYLYLPYLLADLGEIWCVVSSHDASEQFEISWNSVQ